MTNAAIKVFCNLIFIVSVFFEVPVQAQVKGGPVVVAASAFAYTGTGCPSGTATTTFNSSSSRLDVHFTSFIVNANSSVGASKVCALSMVLTPPQGYWISVHPAIYLGTVAQNTQTATLDAGHDWAGATTAPYSANLNKPNFSVVNRKNPPPYAKCGQPSMLQDKITLMVSAGEAQIAQLSQAWYTIQHRKCI